MWLQVLPGLRCCTTPDPQPGLRSEQHHQALVSALQSPPGRWARLLHGQALEGGLMARPGQRDRLWRGPQGAVCAAWALPCRAGQCGGLACHALHALHRVCLGGLALCDQHLLRRRCSAVVLPCSQRAGQASAPGRPPSDPAAPGCPSRRAAADPAARPAPWPHLPASHKHQRSQAALLRLHVPAPTLVSQHSHLHGRTWPRPGLLGVCARTSSRLECCSSLPRPDGQTWPAVACSRLR